MGTMPQAGYLGFQGYLKYYELPKVLSIPGYLEYEVEINTE